MKRKAKDNIESKNDEPVLFENLAKKNPLKISFALNEDKPILMLETMK